MADEPGETDGSDGGSEETGGSDAEPGGTEDSDAESGETPATRSEPADGDGGTAESDRSTTVARNGEPDHPHPDHGEDIDPQTFRLLVVGSVVLAVLVLLAIGGIAAVSEFTGSATPDGPPDALFSVDDESVDGGVAANVTHRSGDAVNPDHIVIEVDGERRATWAELSDRGLGIVGPGQSVVYADVEPGQEVRVLWVPEDRDDDPVQLGRGVVSEP